MHTVHAYRMRIKFRGFCGMHLIHKIPQNYFRNSQIQLQKLYPRNLIHLKISLFVKP